MLPLVVLERCARGAEGGRLGNEEIFEGSLPLPLDVAARGALGVDGLSGIGAFVAGCVGGALVWSKPSWSQIYQENRQTHQWLIRNHRPE